MTRIDFHRIPTESATIDGHPIIGVAFDLAEKMHHLTGHPELAEIVDMLAELPWTDAADEGPPPGTMWWTVVHVVTPEGVSSVHLQAEPIGHSVGVYLPTIHGDEQAAV